MNYAHFLIDSGYDSTSGYCSTETAPIRSERDAKCFSVYGTDEFKTFNSYFNKAERLRSSSCSKASKFLDDKKIQEKNFKNFKEKLSSTTTTDADTKRDVENIYELADTTGLRFDSLYHKSAQDDRQDYKIVVAVDIGTTHSGYAYSFVNSHDTTYLMRK